MKLVKIRKGTEDCYLAYFLESRKILPINYLGALIIDHFFNKNCSMDKILKSIRQDKKIFDTNKDDIKNFLCEVKNQIISSCTEGHPVFGKVHLRVPISVELQINTKCNLRCKHCFQAEYTKTMPFKKVKAIIEKLSREKVFEINLVGGEVFLHPQFWKILSLCEKHDFVINIVSNGTLITENMIKKLAKIRNLAILISLEGVGEINDQIRGVGVFEKVDKTIRKMKENGIYVEISSTINAPNISHYQEMVAYSKKLDVPCNFNLFKPFMKQGHSPLIVSPQDYFRLAKNIFRDWNSVKSKTGLTSASVAAKLTSGKRRDECRATITGLTIDVEGKMIPCASLQEAGFYNNSKLPVFDKNFIKTWNNNKFFEEFRKRGLSECQARAYIFNGDVNGKDPYGAKALNSFIK